MKRSLTELKPHEVLGVAISMETRNAAIYSNYAEMFRGYDPEIEYTFIEMAAEEVRHGGELAVLYIQKFGDLKCAVTDEDVWEVIEAPVLEDGEAFITATMQVIDALRVALTAEQRAAAFYRQLASEVADPQLSAIYTELAGVEVGHEVLIEARLAQYELMAQG
jgi:rubrerythrin